MASNITALDRLNNLGNSYRGKYLEMFYNLFGGDILKWNGFWITRSCVHDGEKVLMTFLCSGQGSNTVDYNLLEWFSLDGNCLERCGGNTIIRFAYQLTNMTCFYIGGYIFFSSLARRNVGGSFCMFCGCLDDLTPHRERVL